MVGFLERGGEGGRGGGGEQEGEVGELGVGGEGAEGEFEEGGCWVVVRVLDGGHEVVDGAEEGGRRWRGPVGFGCAW